jgi:hypothetical protein
MVGRVRVRATAVGRWPWAMGSIGHEPMEYPGAECGSAAEGVMRLVRFRRVPHVPSSSERGPFRTGRCDGSRTPLAVLFRRLRFWALHPTRPEGSQLPERMAGSSTSLYLRHFRSQLTAAT